MFETFALWLHDDTFSKAYILVLMAVMVLPMVLLARWYHGNITNTEGGRKLMKRQNAGQVRPRSLRGVADGAGMAHDISAGRYGEHARNMQRRVYIYVLRVVARRRCPRRSPDHGAGAVSAARHRSSDPVR